MADPRLRLLDHLRAHALRTDGPFTLASGSQADWYMDARQTTFSATGAPLVGAAVLAVLDPNVTAVGGMTMGADPIALATAICSGGSVDAFSIRKSTKDHGTGGRLVGPIEEGHTVAILEDTTTTGAALTQAIDAARDYGLVIAQAISLFDRSGSTVRDNMAALSIPYVALATPTDLNLDT